MALKLPKEKSVEMPALLWKRMAAFVLDLFILRFIVMAPFIELIGGMIPETNSFEEMYNYLASSSETGAIITAASIAIAILSIIYFSVLESKFGQTIGKMIMGIYVRSDADGRFGHYILRSMFIVPIFPFVLLWVVDPLFLMFTHTNQRLSEFLSRTRTVANYKL